MRSANIKLSLTENVKTFVNIVSRYGYDVDLRSGRHCVASSSSTTITFSTFLANA